MAYFPKMDLYDSQVVLSAGPLEYQQYFLLIWEVRSELIAMPRQLLISLHNNTRATLKYTYRFIWTMTNSQCLNLKRLLGQNPVKMTLIV